MGILDYIEQFFQPVTPPEGYKDPSSLPKDVENDLRSKILSNHPPPSLHSNHPTPYNNHHPADHQNNTHNEGENKILNDGEQIMREMDNMMKNFFNFRFHQIPSFEIPQNEEGEDVDQSHNENNKSLRDKMLGGGNQDNHQNEMIPFHNNPDEREFFGDSISSMFRNFFNFPMSGNNDFFRSPFQNNCPESQEDEDLDSEITSGNRSLEDVFPSDRNNQMFPRHNRNMFNFSTSTVRKMNSDGSVETRTTSKDAEGNEQVVVSRTLNGQTHTVTTKTLPNGEQDKQEDFVNLKPDELKDFEEKWTSKKKSTSNDDFGGIFPWGGRPKL